MRKDPYTL